MTANAENRIPPKVALYRLYSSSSELRLCLSNSQHIHEFLH